MVAVLLGPDESMYLRCKSSSVRRAFHLPHMYVFFENICSNPFPSYAVNPKRGNQVADLTSSPCGSSAGRLQRIQTARILISSLGSRGYRCGYVCLPDLLLVAVQ